MVLPFKKNTSEPHPLPAFALGAGRRAFPETEKPPAFGKEERPPCHRDRLLFPGRGFFMGGGHAAFVQGMAFPAVDGIFSRALHPVASRRDVPPRRLGDRRFVLFGQRNCRRPLEEHLDRRGGNGRHCPLRNAPGLFPRPEHLPGKVRPGGDHRRSHHDSPHRGRHRRPDGLLPEGPRRCPADQGRAFPGEQPPRHHSRLHVRFHSLLC